MKEKLVLFLDRDGVINEKRLDYVKNINELKFLPNIFNSIKKFKDIGFMIIIITNQSAINRNLMTHEQLNEIHSHIQQYLKSFDTSIDNFYFCPHKPDENCNCRKPKSGMLLEAIQEFNIDPKLSWMIGDNDSDIQAGLNVGCQTIKIGKNINLQKAVDKILN